MRTEQWETVLPGSIFSIAANVWAVDPQQKRDLVFTGQGIHHFHGSWGVRFLYKSEDFALMASTGTMVLGSVCKQNPMWYCNSPEQHESPKKAQKTDLIQYWPLQGSYCHRAGFTICSDGSLALNTLRTSVREKSDCPYLSISFIYIYTCWRVISLSTFWPFEVLLVGPPRKLLVCPPFWGPFSHYKNSFCFEDFCDEFLVQN